jgi:hypothetical protein
MPVNLPRLFLGTLAYDEPVAALDDARFERVIDGFAGHYLVTPLSNVEFRFERSEGFDRFGRWDAFAYVDGGSVMRLRDRTPIEGADAKVAVLPPPWFALHFTLSVRVILIFWAAGLALGWFFLGGAWIFWLFGFFGLYGLHIALIRASLRRKLAVWLAREGWN